MSKSPWSADHLNTREVAQAVKDGLRKPLGYVQLTSLGSAVGFTDAQIPAAARFALIQAESQIVRWRDDGVDPSATVGMTIAAAATLAYSGDLTAIRFIEATASAKLNVVFYD